MTTKQKLTIDELFDEWQFEHEVKNRPDRLPPGELRGVTNAQRINEGFKRGEPAIVRAKEGFTWGPKLYKVGDEFMPRDGESVDRLAVHNFIVPKRDWERGLKYSFYKNYNRTVLTPKYQQILKERKDRERNMALRAAVLSDLAKIEADLRDNDSRLEHYEQELKEALDLAPQWTAKV